MLPEIRTVLYATDLSPRAQEVFRYAVSVAVRYDAKLVIVHAVEPLSPTAQTMVGFYVSKEITDAHRREVIDRAVADIRGRIERFCDEEAGACPQVRDRVSDIRVVEGRPADVVCRETERAKADLIVMGSHGHSAVGEILLGTTAHKVMQRAPAPVLLVRLKKKG